MQLKEFYIIPEDVFRVGNATSTLLTKIRGGEVDTYVQNGVVIVVANGKGVSVYNADELSKTTLTGWVWKLSGNKPLPIGLVITGGNDGHYHICPSQNMPVDKYKGLLEELGVSAQRVWKKAA